MATAPPALALLLLALTTATAATSDARVPVAAGGYTLAECHQRQAAPPSASNGSDSAFRADILALLGNHPSAAVPTGFAALHSDNGPFVRGLCFDDSPPSGGCAGCLSDAATTITDECGGSRRAGVWNAGCFVAYGDTDTTSPHEDAYRGRDFSAHVGTKPAFYDAHELAALALSLAPRAADSSSGPMMVIADMKTARKGKVHAAAHCARDVTATDCARCLEKSAQELQCCGGGGLRLDGRHEGVAVVAGFNCHLRLEIHPPDLPFGKMILKTMKENLTAVIVFGTLVTVGVIAIIILRVRMVAVH